MSAEEPEEKTKPIPREINDQNSWEIQQLDRFNLRIGDIVKFFDFNNFKFDSSMVVEGYEEKNGHPYVKVYPAGHPETGHSFLIERCVKVGDDNFDVIATMAENAVEAIKSNERRAVALRKAIFKSRNMQVKDGN